MDIPILRNESQMTKKRFYEYKREIARLRKVDTEITNKVQHQLNVMDEKEKEQERKSRVKILEMDNFEIEYDDENLCVTLIFHNDKKEISYHCSLCGDLFERMEYDCPTPDPTDVRERGKENIFCGDNKDYWEDYEIFEVFHNNIFKFSIKITEY